MPRRARWLKTGFLIIRGQCVRFAEGARAVGHHLLSSLARRLLASLSIRRGNLMLRAVFASTISQKLLPGLTYARNTTSEVFRCDHKRKAIFALAICQEFLGFWLTGGLVTRFAIF